ncbi:hypothetical protein BZG02_09275 [Labilibaculum filiforme]|uniref:Uncharacterized protein n=1 Tax=Labilibaculum filiforme TaxID=1940526 RepID=A0A2N3HZS2_9BACT|nr:class I lanthipeptide [Labilibaculum filiforme]PKQ63552.1 hypothetical protein BZG02_09275 [Labilibaculum filiforme]
MKKKSLNSKLVLKKETISNLNMSEVKGGRLPGGQTGDNGCDGTWVSVLYCDDKPATAMACSMPCAIEKRPTFALC